MKKTLSFVILLLAVGCSNNNGNPENKSKTDSIRTTASTPAKGPSSPLKDLIVGTWAGEKDHEKDTLQIGKDKIADAGEGTQLNYTLQGDSINIFSDLPQDKDKVYKAKVVISGNTLTFTDVDNTSILTRVQ
jgi:hypothetical protein